MKEPIQIILPTVDAAVCLSAQAQLIFQNQSLSLRRKIIKAIRDSAIINAERWANLTVEETHMGRVEDKTLKNRLCATRTPGVEDLQSRAYTGDKGLALVQYVPFGVVAAITPSNNPVATIISNAIGILSAGNSVVFCPHPSAVKSSYDAIQIIAAATVSAGAPEGLITSISPIIPDTAKSLLAHPGVKLNLVTGGSKIVKIAMSIGKVCKTIAAGPGNPPVVVDGTAAFPQCAEDIILGASFDNNLLCISEKVVIVVDSAKVRFLESMRMNSKCYELSVDQMDALAMRLIFPPGMEDCHPFVNREYVGRDAYIIAQSIGLDIPTDIRLLWGFVPPEHPFIMIEQLMPILPVTVSDHVESAIEYAALVEGGNHHSAAMYSTNIENISKMLRRMECSVFVNNAPTLYGLGLGEGYASMSIGTPTGDGITKPSDFVRPLHCCLVGNFRIA